MTQVEPRVTVVALYERILAMCSTENEVNNLQLQLGHRMTPLELDELRRRYLAVPDEPADRPSIGRRAWTVVRRRVGRPVPPPPLDPAEERTRTWVHNLLDQYLLAGKSAPEPYTRHRIVRGATRFSTDGASAERTLLLCFSGDAPRVGMPMPGLLQHLPAREADVIWLHTERGRGYRDGIRGIGPTLMDSIDALPDLVGLRNYRRVATIGTSGGGLPSLLAALRLNADAALAVSGNNPRDERWAGYFDGRDAGPQLEMLAAAASRPVNVTLAYCEDHRRDPIKAAGTIEFLPETWTRRFPVPGKAHNVLFHLAQRHELTALLRATVLPARS